MFSTFSAGGISGSFAIKYVKTQSKEVNIFIHCKIAYSGLNFKAVDLSVLISICDKIYIEKMIQWTKSGAIMKKIQADLALYFYQLLAPQYMIVSKSSKMPRIDMVIRIMLPGF